MGDDETQAGEPTAPCLVIVEWLGGGGRYVVDEHNHFYQRAAEVILVV